MEHFARPAGIAFTAEGHASRLLDKMATLRKDRRLCDVVLKIGDKEICAHRLVLSACSSYFCAMFTNSMMESSMETVTLTDLDEAAVDSLVDFAYTARVDVHEGNVQSLLKAASILQLSEIVGACCSYLTGQLHPSNCLGIARFADAHGCTALRDSAMEYVLDHFTEVFQCEEFLHQRFEEVDKLLSSDLILVTSEEVVFGAMYRWLQHDLPVRGQHAFKLLSCIRLPLLKSVFLADGVYSKEVFRCDPRCMELIISAIIYHNLQERSPHLPEVLNARPRKATLGTIFVIGGMDTCRNKVGIEYFDARRDQWVLVSTSQAACRRLQFGVAVLNSNIYLVGGRNGLRTLNSVDSYNPCSDTWESVVPMCSYRHGVGVETMHGPLYAVGGHDGWSYLSSVERYDPEVKQWSYVAPMHSARSTAGVAVLDNKLYVVGGRDSNSCLNSVECYNPHTNRWAQLPPMGVCRGGVGVAVLRGKLYALGGHEISAPLASVEVYDPKTNEWCTVAPMLCARDAVAAVTFGGKLYAIGGFNGSLYLDSVECYNEERDEWSKAPELRSSRAGAGVVVMEDCFVEDLAHQ